MASLVYNGYKAGVMNGSIDTDTDDVRVALVMTNTTCDTEEDVVLMNAFTTLDEQDGAAYVRKALSLTIQQDDTNDRAELIVSAATTWTALGIGTRLCQGVLFLKHVTNDTDSIPLFFSEFSANVGPANPTGDFTINWDAQGAIQLS